MLQAFSDFSIFDGQIFLGANQENLSRSQDVHAERLAIMNAVQAGYKRSDFLSLALVYGNKPITGYAYPMCGLCRQFAWENATGEMGVLVVQPDGEVVFCGPLKILYPLPYPDVPPARINL